VFSHLSKFLQIFSSVSRHFTISALKFSIATVSIILLHEPGGFYLSLNPLKNFTCHLCLYFFTILEMQITRLRKSIELCYKIWHRVESFGVLQVFERLDQVRDDVLVQAVELLLRLPQLVLRQC